MLCNLFLMPSVKSSLKSINPESVCGMCGDERAFYANLRERKNIVQCIMLFFYSKIQTHKN